MNLPVRALLITLAAAVPAVLAGCAGDGGALDTLPPIRTTTTTTVPPTTIDETRYFWQIKSGENLNMIAQAFCVPFQALLDLNRETLPDPNNVPAGAMIEIPKGMQVIGCTPKETIAP
jgi:hypothetical protein